MDANELEYQRIVDTKINAKVEARIKALALRARADAKRALRYHAEPKNSERRVFQTNHGPAYSVERVMSVRGQIGRETIRISLPYVSILGER
jgi:hypothetical protein